MNFIGKHLNLIGILLLTVFIAAAAGLYLDAPTRLRNAAWTIGESQNYTCPMHPEVVGAKPGKCSKCGMALVTENQAKGHQCGDNEEPHAGCCADKSATEMELPPGHPPIRDFTPDGWRTGGRDFELPPGHPPIHGWPTNATTENGPGPLNPSGNSPD